VEYTPQQNERANRTLVEMARCLMLQANLPQSLWAEAINAATYIRNRCSTKILNEKTPFKMWSNKKPYVGFMRIIRSKGIVLNKSSKRGKFEPKGDEYILVGYDNISKAYRLWKRGSKMVIKAHDVKFMETTGLHEKLSIKIEDQIIKTDNSDKEPEELVGEEEGSSDESETEEPMEITSASNEESGRPKRGRGRPKIERTGKVGRPKKNLFGSIKKVKRPNNY